MRRAATAPPPDLYAAALVDLAAVEAQTGQLFAARRHLAEALTLYTDTQCPAGRARVLLALGDIELAQGGSRPRRAPGATGSTRSSAPTMPKPASPRSTACSALAASDPAQAQAYAERAAALRGTTPAQQHADQLDS